jgi:hypothetical protein
MNTDLADGGTGIYGAACPEINSDRSAFSATVEGAPEISLPDDI